MVVRINPEGSFGPGCRNLAMRPANEADDDSPKDAHDYLLSDHENALRDAGL
jgi:hypothetical protein